MPFHQMGDGLTEEIVARSNPDVESTGNLLQRVLAILRRKETLPARLVQQRLHPRDKHGKVAPQLREHRLLGLDRRGGPADKP
ncbi:hypothetical protein JMJ77_0004397 [Colletotrichum scovillei]|uniref:Uncharacterized protein n=1 Tax=Colletotrichum scovillei TaxID=1209932 RepID=A0A9P7QYH5_9PEZI|nr:hypothetical protein JMJ77_0004397 [Colletotrichum scovillei]KAG7049650.1 hypothetical protein JMJ78_0013629 [Colletotrichum scovillei]KAG7064393.1 hypothetical protein JMJ76_0007437 [Colletotrichum scovillei]